MKSNRSEEMNYEKMSRAMRYHYGCERQGRKGHLAMVKEKRLYYKWVQLFFLTFGCKLDLNCSGLVSWLETGRRRRWPL